MSEVIEAVKEAKPDTRAQDILKMSRNLKDKIAGVRDMAEKAIEDGQTVEQFRQACLDKLPTATPVGEAPKSFTPRDISGYSITRAINGIMSGKLDGLERELSDELAIRNGRAATGFWLPNEVLVVRSAVAGTGTLGGMVVSTPNLGSEFIELLRNRAVVGQLGARMLSLANPVTIPRQNGAGTVNWTNGETAASTLSAVNFTQLTLSPKCATSELQYSKQLLATSNPSIDALLRDDAIQSIALAIDLAAFHGSGSTGEPTGIASTTGIATVSLGSNGAALTTANAYPSLVSLETEIATDNADVAGMAYVVNAATRGKLKTITKTGLDSVFCWEPGNTLNGYRTAISNQLKTNLTDGTATTICTAAFFGNFNDLLIAEFGGGTDIVVDPYTLASNRVVRLITNKWVDIGVRHPQSFSAILDILN
jgi:HK97 family phage major capsid protein